MVAGPIPNIAYALSNTYRSRSKVPESKYGCTSILRPLDNTTSKAYSLVHTSTRPKNTCRD
jgi:hypothetical protein